MAVAIGIVVAYLSLDRFRYHKRIIELTAKLNGVLAPTDILVQNVKENAHLTQIEKNFLAVHYLCGTEWGEAVKAEKAAIFNGGLDNVLRYLLTLLTYKKVDRIVAAFLCFTLCIWELYISLILFTTDDPPKWLGFSSVEFAEFGAVLAAYIVPLVAFAIGELIMALVRKTVRRWMDEENVRQSRGATNAAVPGLSNHAT